MSSSRVEKVHRHFQKADPAIFDLLKKMKLEILPQERNSGLYFSKLCREITSQQLAGKAAQAIHGRFLGLFPKGRLTPQRVLAVPEKKMRAVGLSWAKARYIRDLADKVLDRQVNLKGLHALEDELVIAELVKVKGIGRWTAEMFLIFTLGREDVFSHGDLGLMKGLERVYGGRRIRTRKSIDSIISRWSPYRSYGSLALWRAMDTKEK